MTKPGAVPGGLLSGSQHKSGSHAVKPQERENSPSEGRWEFIDELLSSGIGKGYRPTIMIQSNSNLLGAVGQDLEVRVNGERVSTICFLYFLQAHILQGEDIICPSLHEILSPQRSTQSLTVPQSSTKWGKCGSANKISFLIRRWTNGRQMSLL